MLSELGVLDEEAKQEDNDQRVAANNVQVPNQEKEVGPGSILEKVIEEDAKIKAGSRELQPHEPGEESTASEKDVNENEKKARINNIGQSTVPKKVRNAESGLLADCKSKQEAASGLAKQVVKQYVSDDPSGNPSNSAVTATHVLHRDPVAPPAPRSPGAIPVEGSLTTPHYDEADAEIGGSNSASLQNESPPEENLVEAELVDEEKVYVTATPAPRDNKRWVFVGAGIAVVVAVVIVVLATTLQNNNSNNGSNEPSYTDILQFGNTMIGSAPGDRFGAPLALNANGTILAIGSRQATTVGEDSGLVGVYQVKFPGDIEVVDGEAEVATETQWDRLGNSIWGEAAGDEFAFSGMAMNAAGSRIAVGAPYRDVTTMTDPNGTDIVLEDAGNVRVFDLMDGSWTQVGPSINGRQAGDALGRAVAMSADGKIVAGASYQSSENGENCGNVMIFREATTQSETGNMVEWQLMGSVLLGRVGDDRFGRSLDMSSDGKRIVVGATQFKAETGGAGYAQVYEFDGTDWQQIGQDLWGDEDQDVFGRDVAISDDGSIVACGANLASPNNLKDAGLARVYQYDAESNAWVQLGQDIEGTAEGDNLGLALDLSADGYRVAVGASQKKTSVGYVQICDYDTNNYVWTQAGQDLQGEVDYDAEGELINEKFGSDVQFASDGSMLAVGVIAGDINGKGSGHVQVFEMKRL